MLRVTVILLILAALSASFIEIETHQTGQHFSNLQLSNFAQNSNEESDSASSVPEYPFPAEPDENGDGVIIYDDYFGFLTSTVPEAPYPTELAGSSDESSDSAGSSNESSDSAGSSNESSDSAGSSNESSDSAGSSNESSDSAGSSNESSDSADSASSVPEAPFANEPAGSSDETNDSVDASGDNGGA
ncbi:uncharacterized protein [Paramormyrops kingsleyae]|uniref:uncharacterized protein isoform X31 n=1 Tax=Paramormyrops kingsleyae TaxID=1676925 RepID=UPI003B96C524